MTIETGDILRGKLPRKVSQLVKEWADLHREDLLEDWRLAQLEQGLLKIEPLE